MHAESRADQSTNGLWKRGKTAMFDIIIFNLNVGSYLRMMTKKSLVKSDKDQKDLYLQSCLERRHAYTTMV